MARTIAPSRGGSEADDDLDLCPRHGGSAAPRKQRPVRDRPLICKISDDQRRRRCDGGIGAYRRLSAVWAHQLCGVRFFVFAGEAAEPGVRPSGPFAYGLRHGRAAVPDAAAGRLSGSPSALTHSGRAREADGVWRPAGSSVRLVTDDRLHRNRCARLLRRQASRRAGHALTVAIANPLDESRILGGASLYDVDLGAECAGIGYWLAPAARGQRLTRG